MWIRTNDIRWKIHHGVIVRKKLIDIGKIRQVIKFAWFPVRIDNYKVWGERYIENQEFVKYFDYGRWDRGKKELISNSVDFITKK